MRIISPSLLSADFSILKDQIQLVEDLGIDRLHIDVMDGHFVPNFTFGPFILKAIRKLTNSHLETHLMMSNPHKYLKDFVDAGADTLIIHTEASNNISRDLNEIKDLGVKCGLAIKPGTDESVLNEYVDILLTIKNDVSKRTAELIIAVSSNCTRFVRLKIRGKSISPAAAGDGTPSKKLIFHVSASSITVKLNLAKRRAQHTV